MIGSFPDIIEDRRTGRYFRFGNVLSRNQLNVFHQRPKAVAMGHNDHVVPGQQQGLYRTAIEIHHAMVSFFQGFTSRGPGIKITPPLVHFFFV